MPYRRLFIIWWKVWRPASLKVFGAKRLWHDVLYKKELIRWRRSEFEIFSSAPNNSQEIRPAEEKNLATIWTCESSVELSDEVRNSDYTTFQRLYFWRAAQNNGNYYWWLWSIGIQLKTANVSIYWKVNSSCIQVLVAIVCIQQAFAFGLWKAKSGAQ